MHTLVNTPLCRECRDVHERFDCQETVNSCDCITDHTKCNCCKICKYSISYGTNKSPILTIDESDLTYCSRCNSLLTHVYKDGELSSLSLTNLHKKLNFEPVSMDVLHISSKDKRGYTVFCDDCVLGFDMISNCSRKPCCEICKDVSAITLNKFQFIDYNKIYNVCFLCKRFVEYIYKFPRNPPHSEGLEYKDFDIDNLHYIIKYKKYDICTITRRPNSSRSFNDAEVALYSSVLHQFKTTVVIARNDGPLRVRSHLH